MFHAAVISHSQYPVKETTFHCTDLYDDTEYEFRVSAENKVGSGPPSNPSTPFISRDPWSECCCPGLSRSQQQVKSFCCTR